MRGTTGMTGRIGQNPAAGRIWRRVMSGAPARMLMVLAIGMGLGGILSPAHAAPSTQAPPILGEWETKDHDGVFRIMQCGTEVCGDLVGLSYTKDVPKDHAGHSECGLRMLTGFTPDPEETGHWNGHILDPDSGRVYHAKIWIAPNGALKLRGFVGVPLFGETETWTPFTGRIGPECRLP
ncbi:DUF2147 domain-containing protein [Gluconacetobacter entanii]|uniref:DUF2147 domain-containing protein n=3 Tax=Gluconacetobacter entanii TaxID=108528 RepID=UPI001D11DC84|nr:DUF2147 domain-containing protein [Gluconacetobacter entanii]MCW4581068.1 DUF2147 domain-containing protein [Gluconacetobacter entanii]MCW4584263.1 DUF2147 domain-containing protein [Gluconacetobacter entanii]